MSRRKSIINKLDIFSKEFYLLTRYNRYASRVSDGKGKSYIYKKYDLSDPLDEEFFLSELRAFEIIKREGISLCPEMIDYYIGETSGGILKSYIKGKALCDVSGKIRDEGAVQRLAFTRDHLHSSGVAGLYILPQNVIYNFRDGAHLFDFDQTVFLDELGGIDFERHVFADNLEFSRLVGSKFAA